MPARHRRCQSRALWGAPSWGKRTFVRIEVPVPAARRIPAPRRPAPPAAPSTRDRILDAAESLFAERGFAGTAVRDIAGRCHLNAASLYNHFAGKQALYEAVLERGIHPLRMLLEDYAARADGPEATGELIEAVMAHLARHPELPRLVQMEAATGGGHLARLAHRWMRPLLAQALAAAKRDADRGWSAEDAPLLLMAWLNLVFGPFALAPLLREVLDEDPLAPANLARHTRFLRRLADRMSVPEAPKRKRTRP